MAGKRPVRAAVLISGSGSNLQSLIDAAQAGANYNIDLVVSNNASAFGLQRADAAGIATAVLDHRQYDSRDAYDEALQACLRSHAIELVFLAGFMRILGQSLVRNYAGRMLNIHPSLLPKFPGLDTHQRVLDAGERWHGCTVHFVTAELDAGAAIIQARLPVRDDTDAKALAKSVLTYEHRIYPVAAEWLASGRLRLVGECAELDGVPLQGPQQFSEIRSSVA